MFYKPGFNKQNSQHNSMHGRNQDLQSGVQIWKCTKKDWEILTNNMSTAMNSNSIYILYAVVCITYLCCWEVCVSTPGYCPGVLDHQRVNELSTNNLNYNFLIIIVSHFFHLFKCLFLGHFIFHLFDYYVWAKSLAS